eukprot:TRINITY_DN6460_c3_g1_i1.p1 TRINITY_DN6460_c3_g1~~TRINITY_DN6460_c3_g1_i1.p1  ORF type:complete len:757 (-),score=238.59 TRINITY_DN6460_c3_g1_i1:51-2282(-)
MATASPALDTAEAANGAASPMAVDTPATPPEPAVPAPAPAPAPVIAFDIGTQTSVVAVAIPCATEAESARLLPQLVPNNLANQTTPSLVAFDDGKRLIGEDAVNWQVRQPGDCVANLKKLLECGTAEVPQWCSAAVAASDKSGIGWQVTVQGQHPYTVEQLIAMLLSRLTEFAVAAASVSVKDCVLAVPITFTKEQRAAFADAARIAGLNPLAVVNETTAVAALYGHTHTQPEGKDVHVMFLDQGHAHTSAAVVKFSKDSIEVLASICDSTFGGVSIDNRLMDHLLKLFQSKQKEPGNVSARSQARLRKAVERAKYILSTVPETEVVVDSFANDTDFRVKLSRATLEELSRADMKQIIEHVITDVLSAAGMKIADLDSVEVVGGGFRSPVLLSAAQEVVGERPLSKTLDSASSIAVGAAIIGKILSGRFGVVTKMVDKAPLECPPQQLPPAAFEEAVTAEKAWLEKDAEQTMIQHKRNEIESYIYETRAECENLALAELFTPQTKEALVNALQETEWWLADLPASAALTEVEKGLEDVRAKTVSVCPKLVEHREAERLRKQKAAEEAAQVKPVFLGTNRPEPRTKSEKLAIANKKKETGNKLVKEGDYENAASRYVQALSHLQSMFDMSPEEKKTVDELAQAIHLNISLCYIKLDRPQKAVENLNKVLEAQKTNVKALFRRAQAYRMLKDYEHAEKDANEALVAEPANTAVKKELSLIKAALAQQNEKSKRMAKAMFAGLGAE